MTPEFRRSLVIQGRDPDYIGWDDPAEEYAAMTWQGMVCGARVRRGGYFDRHDEQCGKPAKGMKAMSIPWEQWDNGMPISEDRPACGVHLRATYVPGFPKADR